MGAFKKDGLFLKQIDSQDTPANNHVVLYANTDGEIHVLTDDDSDNILTSKSYVDTLVSQISSSNNFLNVKDFGAVGDGSTDDTAAIEAAWLALTDTSEPFSPPTSSSDFTQQTKALYFPPGTYVYSGSGLSQTGGRTKHWALYGPHSGTVRIDITSNSYFMDISDPRGVLISGITTNGGKGLLRCNQTGNNVGAITTIQDVQCFDYTECAIGNNANDHPQVIIDRCYFQTKTAYEAIGVAWGGLSDSVKITNSVFFYNKYHIKIGPNMGGSWHIGPNNFFAGETGAGVWIVPRDTAVNIGRGAFISKNKFGNEVQTLTAPRILVASENTSSGTDRLSYHHNPVADTSSFAGHFTIEDNLFGFDSGYSVGVIQSYIKKVCFNIWDNQIDGTKPPYLIEMAGGITQLHGHYEANQWNIGRLQIIGDGSPATGISLSNIPYMGPIPAPWDESIADVSTVVGYAPEIE